MLRGQVGGEAVGESFLDGGLDLFDSVVGVGVGAEEFGLAAVAGGLFEDLHDFDHGSGVVAGLGHEADAEVV